MGEHKIARRSRKAPEPIGDSETRNITFLASSQVFNRIAALAAETGQSMSAVIEGLILSGRDALKGGADDLHRTVREAVRAEFEAREACRKVAYAWGTALNGQLNGVSGTNPSVQQIGASALNKGSF